MCFSRNSEFLTVFEHKRLSDGLRFSDQFSLGKDKGMGAMWVITASHRCKFHFEPTHMLIWTGDNRTWQMEGSKSGSPRSIGFYHSPHKEHLTEILGDYERPLAPCQKPILEPKTAASVFFLDTTLVLGNSAEVLSEESSGWQRKCRQTQ